MNSNIDPTIWGPNAWNFMEHVAFTFPINPSYEDKKNVKTFFTSIGYVLPCEKCRDNYFTHLKKLPLSDNVLSSRAKLINWLTQMHNQVNIINNKPIITYDKAVSLYYNRLNNKQKYEQYVNIIFIGLLLLLIIFFINKKKK